MKKRTNTRDYLRRIAATAALLTALAVHAQSSSTGWGYCSYCGKTTSCKIVETNPCEGSTFYMCRKCGSFFWSFVDPLGHDWSGWAQIAATCTTGGYDEHTCNRCGATERQNETSPLGHDWGDWTAVAATCTTGGYEARTCRRSGCGATERQNETPPLGHMFGADNICSQCGLAMLLDNSANDIDALAGSQRDVLIGGRSIYRDGDWNTLCLPFALPTLAGTPLEGFTVMELDGQASNLSDGVLTLTFKDATAIEAGKPYILKWETTGTHLVNPLFQGVTITSTTPAPATSSDGTVMFVGQYDPINVTEPNRYIMLGSKNTLGYAATGNTLRPFRAHFEIASIQPVKAYNISFGSGASSVVNSKFINSKFKIDDAWYSIDGRKLPGKPTKKGIYIHNGKKVAL
ncbi:MAG: hypothetical protein K6F20_12820 [Bacteroidaceae bacterium]|nr:hypothetical protein [Bacteroidaceae bacterium]